jgi:hypothetical protein
MPLTIKPRQKMKNLSITKSIERSRRRRGVFVFSLALACFALSSARAVSPAPDGGYSGNNTAEGTDALFSLTTGTDNTATGFNALYSNTTGTQNTAIGSQALLNNTSAANTAIGSQALYSSMNGFNNTAIGAAALLSDTTGAANAATGISALVSNTTGSENTADGAGALSSNTTGSTNIAIGYDAGVNLTTGSNNIDIGNNGAVGEANTIRIGIKGTQTKTFIAGIYGATTSGGVAVYINSSGKLGTATSSARFKENIRDMGEASHVLLSLRPVAFRYKSDIDPGGLPQFGLVAEEVDKVDPDLVVHDADDKAYTVRYEAVNAMLLNEFLKAHRKAQEQDRQLHKQAATIAKQQKQIDALSAGLQKVNDKLELNKPEPRLAGTNQ